MLARRVHVAEVALEAALVADRRGACGRVDEVDGLGGAGDGVVVASCICSLRCRSMGAPFTAAFQLDSNVVCRSARPAPRCAWASATWRCTTWRSRNADAVKLGVLVWASSMKSSMAARRDAATIR